MLICFLFTPHNVAEGQLTRKFSVLAFKDYADCKSAGRKLQLQAVQIKLSKIRGDTSFKRGLFVMNFTSPVFQVRCSRLQQEGELQIS